MNVRRKRTQGERERRERERDAEEEKESKNKREEEKERKRERERENMNVRERGEDGGLAQGDRQTEKPQGALLHATVCVTAPASHLYLQRSNTVRTYARNVSTRSR
jgi:hypothetical protein